MQSPLPLIKTRRCWSCGKLVQDDDFCPYCSASKQRYIRAQIPPHIKFGPTAYDLVLLLAVVILIIIAVVMLFGYFGNAGFVVGSLILWVVAKMVKEYGNSLNWW